MTDTQTPAPCCDTPELWVTNGIVRCVSCDTWMPEHKDSAPRPGLLAANQWR